MPPHWSTKKWTDFSLEVTCQEQLRSRHLDDVRFGLRLQPVDATQAAVLFLDSSPIQAQVTASGQLQTSPTIQNGLISTRSRQTQNHSAFAERRRRWLNRRAPNKVLAPSTISSDKWTISALTLRRAINGIPL